MTKKNGGRKCAVHIYIYINIYIIIFLIRTSHEEGGEKRDVTQGSDSGNEKRVPARDSSVSVNVGQER